MSCQLLIVQQSQFAYWHMEPHITNTFVLCSGDVGSSVVEMNVFRFFFGLVVIESALVLKLFADRIYRWNFVDSATASFHVPHTCARHKSRSWRRKKRKKLYNLHRVERAGAADCGKHSSKRSLKRLDSRDYICSVWVTRSPAHATQRKYTFVVCNNNNNECSAS